MGDDAELLDAWAAGDRVAGNALMRRHFDSLYRFFETKAAHDVDELLQRSLLACVERRDDFRRRSSFRAFLYGIARVELLNHYRRRAQSPREVDASVSSAEDMLPTASQRLAQRDTIGQLLAALQGIPLDLQIAVELYYWEGLSAPELGEILAVPEGTVRSRLRRAKELVREKMGHAPTTESDTEAELREWADELRQRLGRNPTTDTG